MTNVEDFKILFIAANMDDKTHVKTMKMTSAHPNVGPLVAVQRLGKSFWLDVMTPAWDLNGHLFRELVSQVIKSADACGVTLKMSRPGGQDAFSEQRVWLHQTFGFQDDEDGCWLQRLPGGVPDESYLGGFDLDPDAEMAELEEIMREMAEESGICCECGEPLEVPVVH